MATYLVLDYQRRVDVLGELHDRFPDCHRVLSRVSAHLERAAALTDAPAPRPPFQLFALAMRAALHVGHADSFDTLIHRCATGTRMRYMITKQGCCCWLQAGRLDPNRRPDGL